jgi:hypothetical protein
MLKPETLGVRQVLDHAQRRPPGRHDGLPKGGLVETVYDG